MTNTIHVSPSGQSCGARVTGVDLTAAMSADEIEQIRTAWLQHHVLAFPDQDMSDDDLERFTLAFGPFGEDPFIGPVEGREHIVAVQRAADEITPVFAEVWHTDWSFQETPPAGTCLFGITIPPVGGDTLFCNQHHALADMPEGLYERLRGLNAVHSAKLAYTPDGAYGKADVGRTMDIRPSDTANLTQTHALIRPHPETGEMGIFGCAGYILGFEGLPADVSEQLLMELYQWQTQPQFQYRHRWQEKMLLMWDNRSVLHMASGGYDGHARYLHRTTIGEKA